MSYPYTKPQPRYGFRRRWNDPNVGIVGSGPGRPLRRYVTDAEVGLPQRGAGLGSSEASPVTQGIFNVGPAKGFSRGVFTPDPPWATPRYIASQPDGVNGLGGCCGLGAFRGFGADADPCGIDKIKNIIVSKITSSLPNFEIDLIIKKIVIDKSVVGPMLKSVLGGIQTSALTAIDSAANSGISAIRTALTTYITPLIASAVKSALDARCSKDDASCKQQNAGVALMLSGLIDNAMKPLYGIVADEIAKCKGIQTAPADQTFPICTQPTKDGAAWGWENGKSCKAGTVRTGFDPNAITGDPSYCTYYGYTAVPLQPGEFGYDAASPKYKCGSAATQQTIAAMQNITQSMKTVDLNKFTELVTAGGMSTLMIDSSKIGRIDVEQAKCASDGGAWYPGGADCLFDAYGQPSSCVAATSATRQPRYCVPKGTVGSIDAAAAAKASALLLPPLPLPPSTASSSNLPLILGAGAAIVALLLLTK